MQKTTIGLAILILTSWESLSAGGPLESLSESDIVKSTQRLRLVYEGKTPHEADIRLFEKTNPTHAVGIFSTNGNQVTISFRGTAGTKGLLSANLKNHNL